IGAARNTGLPATPNSPSGPASVSRERPQERLHRPLDEQDDDHRREIETPGLPRRQDLSDGPEHRLGEAVQHAHDRMIRAQVDPGDESGGDDDPDVYVEDFLQEADDADGQHPQDAPSSRDRRVARSTAWMRARRNPPSSRAAIPAMVVPPGEETMSLSCPGWTPVSRTSRAEPSTVCAARVIAVARSRPIFTPPSASASMAIATYAGPDPERPVTASIALSSSTTTLPTAAKSSWAASRSPGLSPSARAMAVTPSSTRAGVLGMTRMSRAGLPSCSRSFRVATPAAMEMRSLPSSTTPATSLSTAPMIWGLTARMITSALFTRAMLSATAWMP